MEIQLRRITNGVEQCLSYMPALHRTVISHNAYFTTLSPTAQEERELATWGVCQLKRSSNYNEVKRGTGITNSTSIECDDCKYMKLVTRRLQC